MPNTVQLKKNGQPVFPVTDVSLVMGLAERPLMDAVYAWDGTGTPDITKIPAGVTVEYNTTTYTGTLAASANTTGRFYLVPSTTVQGEYDRYLTDAVSGSYSWKSAGTTAIPTPSIVDNLESTDPTKALSAKQGKVLNEELGELEHKVNEFTQGKFYGYVADADELPEGDIPGFAYVGTDSPFSIYNFDGTNWTDSGLTFDKIPVGNGEDIDYDSQNKLQFANRVYNSQNPNGLGYKILRKELDFASQVADANTIYEIRYDFFGGEATKHDLTFETEVSVSAYQAINSWQVSFKAKTLYYTTIQLLAGETIFINPRCAILVNNASEIYPDSYFTAPADGNVVIASDTAGTLANAYTKISNKITIGANSVLRFNGGSLSNCVVDLNGAYIESEKKCFGDNVILSGTLGNKDALVHWVANNLGRISSITAIKDLGRNIIFDVKELYLDAPIFIKQQHSIHSTGYTRISPINGYSVPVYDVFSAVFITLVNKGSEYEISGLDFDGHLRVNFGVVDAYYGGVVRKCRFRYLLTSACVFGASESSIFDENYVAYCGCALVCFRWLNKEYVLAGTNYDVSLPIGTYTQVEVKNNYIVYCNVGLFLAPLAVNPVIEDNCISESSTFTIVASPLQGIKIRNNYIESSGIANFFVRSGITIQQLLAEASQNVMSSYLQGQHYEFGTLVTGWGLPCDGTQLRPVIAILGGGSRCKVDISGNGISCNLVRTAEGANVSGLSTDTFARGIDSVISTYYADVAFGSNRVYFSNTGITPKYYVFCLSKTLRVTGANVGTLLDNTSYETYRFRDGISMVLPTPKNFIGIGNGTMFNLDILNDFPVQEKIPGANYVSNYHPSISYQSKNIYQQEAPVFYKFGRAWFDALGTTFKSIVLTLPKSQYDGTYLVRLHLYCEDALNRVGINVRGLSGNTVTGLTALVANIPAKTDYVITGILDMSKVGDAGMVSANITSPASPLYIGVPEVYNVNENTDRPTDFSADNLDKMGRPTRGASTDRPLLSSANEDVFFVYNDETLGRPIMWNGTAWVNLDGTALA